MGEDFNECLRGKRLFWLTSAAVAALCLASPAKDFVERKYWEARIPRLVSSRDQNGNGISDTDDLIAGARKVVEAKPFYRSVYYEKEAYPPADEGVCTDLVWRALSQAGYDLKSMIDADIKANPAAYPRVKWRPDPSIDFRRVPNQLAFFRRHGQILTTTIIPGDPDSLVEWQPGDIVTFKDPDHVAILSTRRNARGIPYLIHHTEPYPREADDLMGRYARITGHFRYPAEAPEGREQQSSTPLGPSVRKKNRLLPLPLYHHTREVRNVLCSPACSLLLQPSGRGH